MGSKQQPILNVRLLKFVHGGQVLGESADGMKLLVWGGLPGELVHARVTKKKRTYKEAVVTEVLEPSPDRVSPSEPDSYLSTSPWQIVSQGSECKYKDQILRETFEREGLAVEWGEFQVFGNSAGYRNKMEYGFWGDENGLHFAHFVRGTHGKQIVNPYNLLANDDVAAYSAHMLKKLRSINIRAGDLKTLVVRAARDRNVACALYVKSKDIDFSSFENNPPDIEIYYSDPRSPASVPTEKLHTFGNTILTDTLLGHDISYGVTSFFQVNVPIFEKVLSAISEYVDGASAVDFYSGVGAIGVPVGARILVESEPENVAMAQKNVSDKNIEVIHAPSEQALEHITRKDILIVDPPRAGLHAKVTSRIIEVKPPKIVYMSCNPSTQARDIALLNDHYNVVHAQGYNFFPRTPHIESLIMLELRVNEAA